MKTSARRRSSGFTLLEILVVLSIIAMLAALLFPAFKGMQERSRQTSCITNLHQIYFAVQQYFQDERAYPDSMMDLLPEGAKTADGVIGPQAVGYIKNGDTSIICRNDYTDSTAPRSSYGALSKQIDTDFNRTGTDPITSDPANYVWNYWGYNQDGYAYISAEEAKAGTSLGSPLLVSPIDDHGTADTSDDTQKGYEHESLGGAAAADARAENVLKYSLSNRFADPSTIITHCVYHRPQTADALPKPNDLYYDSATVSSRNARDIVLRLDGSARALNVTTWKNTGNVLADLWQNQIVPN